MSAASPTPATTFIIPGAECVLAPEPTPDTDLRPPFMSYSPLPGSRIRRHLAAWLILAAMFAVGALRADDQSMEKALESFEAGEYQQALEIWLLKAYEGDPEAQYRLGRMFAEGAGTVADASEAVYWYSRAAEQGNAAAQYELGNAWYHGAGVDPDKTKALEWWQVAAENGNADAQYHLGRAYFYGIDRHQDSRLAMEWFTRAADNGNALAQDFLQRVGVSDDAAGNDATGWTGYGRVDDRAIWVYASFNRLSPILRKLAPGDLLRVVEQRRGWFRVQVPGGLPVWVPADKVEQVEDGHRIVGVGVAARPDPENDPSVKPVGMFLDGDRVVPVEENGDWLRVRAPESISGWVEAIDVVEVDADDAVLAAEWERASGSVAASLAALSPRRATMVLPTSTDTAAEQAPGASAAVTDSVPAPPERIEVDTATQEIANTDTEQGPVIDDEPAVASDTDAEQSPVIDGELTAASDTDAERSPVIDGEPAAASDTDAERSPVIDGEPAVASQVSPGDYLRVGQQGQSIYARARLSSARIDLMPAGLLVRVVGREGDWVEVEVPGGLPLWIYSRFIEHDGETGRITGRGVRARPLPSTSGNSQPVGTYPEGVEVRVIAESEQWVRIHAPENIAAWMPVDGLFTVDAEEAAIALQWNEQGADGVVAFKAEMARDDAPAEQVTAENGVSSDDEVDVSRVSQTVSESAATRVEFGRTEVARSVVDANEESLPAAAAEPVEPSEENILPGSESAVDRDDGAADDGDVASAESGIGSAPIGEVVESVGVAGDAPGEESSGRAAVGDVPAPGEPEPVVAESGSFMAPVEEVVESVAVVGSESGEETGGQSAGGEDGVPEETESAVAESLFATAPVGEVVESAIESDDASGAESSKQAAGSDASPADTEPDVAESGSVVAPVEEVVESDVVPESPSPADSSDESAIVQDEGAEMDDSQPQANRAESAPGADPAPRATSSAGDTPADTPEIVAPDATAGETAPSPSPAAEGADTGDDTVVGATEAAEAGDSDVTPSRDAASSADASSLGASSLGTPVLSGDEETAIETDRAPAGGRGEVSAVDSREPSTGLPAPDTRESTAADRSREVPDDSAASADTASVSVTDGQSARDAGLSDAESASNALAVGESAGASSEYPVTPGAGDSSAIAGGGGADGVDDAGAPKQATAEGPTATAGSRSIAMLETDDVGGSDATKASAAVAVSENVSGADTGDAPEPGATATDREIEATATRVSFDDLAWLYRQSPDAFTIEVLRDAPRESVLAAAERIEVGSDIHAFSSREGDRFVYSLMVGSYADLVEVKQALGAVQYRFDAIRSRRLGAVQQQWCARLDNLTPEQLLLVLERCAAE